MNRKSLVLLLDEAAPSFCYYEAASAAGRPMPLEVLDRALVHAGAAGATLQVIAPRGGVPDEVRRRLASLDHVCYVAAAGGGLRPGDVPVIELVGDDDRPPALAAGAHPVAILRVARDQLGRWPAAWRALADQVPRVVLVLLGLPRYGAEDLARYDETLAEAERELAERFAAGRPCELNVLTDRLVLGEPVECGAGLQHLTVTPAGELQLCPGFAAAGEPAVGTLAGTTLDGTALDRVTLGGGAPRIENAQLLGRDRAPICAPCDAFHCRRCLHLNLQATREVNTPPWQLCRAAHLEREATRRLSERLRDSGVAPDLPRIAPVAHADPLERAAPPPPRHERKHRGPVRTVVLFVTEACNLRCRYCYVLHKSSPGAGRRMSFEVARAAVDFFLAGHPERFDEPQVSWMFFGGEPLLEAALIDRVISYIRERLGALDHPWRHASSYWAPTNGTLYRTDAVQRLVLDHGLEARITIDGPKRVHDSQRIYPGGRGSYDDVVASLPLWLAQHPEPRTNLTVARQTLPTLAESVLHLFELGVHGVRAKTVFEDVWQPGDEVVFEQQLERLADEMLARELWRDHECFLLRRDLAHPEPSRRWCTAATSTLAVDVDGRIHPCQRFIASALGQRPARILGDVTRGWLDDNLVRPFVALTDAWRSPEACLSCADAPSCDTCPAHDYDIALTPTIYQRATHICRMHQARVRVNRRFWGEVDRRRQSAGEPDE